MRKAFFIFSTVFVVLSAACLLFASQQEGKEMGEPGPKTYQVQYLPEAKISIDGTLDESEWKKAHRLKDFSFPWEEVSAPKTEFRALFDDEFFYFSFVVDDATMTVEEKFDEELVVAREDRVEIFFAPDKELKKAYFCLEVDPLGRVLDYSAVYYREFDDSWDFSDLQTAGSTTKKGYIVEGSIPLKTLEAIEMPSLSSGDKLFAGVFRAEFIPVKDSEPEMHWLSWIDPETENPDFHVPSAFGYFQMAK